MDNNLVAYFSLTSHPTNPMSVAYTSAAIDFVNILMEGDKDNLKKSIKRLIKTEICDGNKKKPQMELEETMLVLNQIWEALP